MPIRTLVCGEMRPCSTMVDMPRAFAALIERAHASEVQERIKAASDGAEEAMRRATLAGQK